MWRLAEQKLLLLTLTPACPPIIPCRLIFPPLLSFQMRIAFYYYPPPPPPSLPFHPCLGDSQGREGKSSLTLLSLGGGWVSECGL